MEVRRAKRRGQKHFGVETCPQYLFLTDDRYADDQEGLKAIMAPPLRKKDDNEALWQALENGELDAVATDHCPFTFTKQKQQGAKDFTQCPSGSAGRGGAPAADVLRGSKGRASDHSAGGSLFCARIRLRLPDCTRRRAPFRPVLTQIWYSSTRRRSGPSPQRRCTETRDYTCYEGTKVTGAIEKVFLRGNEIVSDGAFVEHAEKDST